MYVYYVNDYIREEDVKMRRYKTCIFIITAGVIFLFSDFVFSMDFYTGDTYQVPLLNSSVLSLQGGNAYLDFKQISPEEFKGQISPVLTEYIEEEEGSKIYEWEMNRWLNMAQEIADTREGVIDAGVVAEIKGMIELRQELKPLVEEYHYFIQADSVLPEGVSLSEDVIFKEWQDFSNTIERIVSTVKGQMYFMPAGISLEEAKISVVSFGQDLSFDNGYKMDYSRDNNNAFFTLSDLAGDFSNISAIRFSIKSQTEQIRIYIKDDKNTYAGPEEGIDITEYAGNFKADGNSWNFINISLEDLKEEYSEVDWSSIKEIGIKIYGRQEEDWLFPNTFNIVFPEGQLSIRDMFFVDKAAVEKSSLGDVKANLNSMILNKNESLTVEDINYIKKIAIDTFNYLLYFVNENTNLPYDNSEKKDYTSITNIGLYLASVAVASENGLIEEEEAKRKIGLTLNSLEKLPKWKGFPVTWVEVSSLKQTGSEPFSYADHVGNLIAGLIVVKSIFEEFEKRISDFINCMDFSSTYDENSGYLKGGYNISVNNFSTEWYCNLFAADTRIFSFYGVASGQIPEKHWGSLSKEYEKEYGRIYYSPGWQGGGLFMQYLPGIFLDEEGTDMKQSAKNFTEAQIIHAKEINSPVWGWSASMDSDFKEYLGWGNIIDNVITPHACVLAIEDFPEETIKNLRKLEQLGAREPFESNEEFNFGFRDSYDFKKQQEASGYLILDQAMVFLSLSNFLWDNTVRKNFAKDPIVQEGYEKMKINY